MANKRIIIGSCLGVLLIAIIGGFFMLTTTSTRVAFLHVEFGTVQVNSGSGWIDASDGMELSLADSVKTGSDGHASVILYESAIISLDPDTEVTIADLDKDNLVIEQDSGSTWNKFTGLSGIGGMEIKTPTTVATVRGTSFAVSMKGIVVVEGTVQVTDLETGETYTITDGKKITMVDGEPVVEELTPQEKVVLADGMKQHLDQMRSLREEEIQKNYLVINWAKRKYDMTDEDLRAELEKADNGEYDVDEMMDKAPVKLDVMEKPAEMTKSIQEQIKAIKELESQ